MPPLTTTVFKLAAADLVAKIAPADGGSRFTVGTGGDVTEAVAVNEILQPAESRVLMRLPGRLRSLCTHVDGEFLTRYAAAGETGPFAFGLTPASNVCVWRSFPGNVTWGRRRSVEPLASSAYTVNAGGTTLTLAAGLTEGQTLVVEYDHGAAATALPELRDIALTLAAVEAARRVGFFADAEGWERFANWEQSAYADLTRHNEIQAFASLDLVRPATADGYYTEVHRLLG